MLVRNDLYVLDSILLHSGRSDVIKTVEVPEFEKIKTESQQNLCLDGLIPVHTNDHSNRFTAKKANRAKFHVFSDCKSDSFCY